MNKIDQPDCLETEEAERLENVTAAAHPAPFSWESVRVPLAFLTVLLIWSTTPLAIAKSVGGVPFTSAIIENEYRRYILCLGAHVAISPIAIDFYNKASLSHQRRFNLRIDELDLYRSSNYSVGLDSGSIWPFTDHHGAVRIAF